MDSDVRADSAAGPSRRDLLRKGAIVGAAAVWAVPVVQVISMTPAHAESASSPTNHQQVPPPHEVTPGKANPQPTPLADDGTHSSLSYTGAPVITTLAAGAVAVATGTGIVLAAKARHRAAEDD